MKNNKITICVDPDLKELIPGYLASRRNDVEEVLLKLESDDFESIRIIGHSMKGSGGGYGFDYISTIGNNIELFSKEKNKIETIKWIKELSQYLKNIDVI